MSASEFGVRERPSRTPSDPSVISVAKAEHARHPSSNTLTYEESLIQVPWQTDNKYIRTGYRRRLDSLPEMGRSLVACKSTVCMFRKSVACLTLGSDHYRRLA